MSVKQKSPSAPLKVFKTESSAKRARKVRKSGPLYTIQIANSVTINWNSKMDRVDIIRKGLPIETVNLISNRTDLPVKNILELLNIKQTTYNKRKRENKLLDGRESEMILIFIELLDFGIDVFNNEEDKFQRWLNKPNVSLGGVSPISLFDSFTGLQEVKLALNRIEYGNMS